MWERDCGLCRTWAWQGAAGTKTSPALCFCARIPCWGLPRVEPTGSWGKGGPRVHPRRGVLQGGFGGQQRRPTSPAPSPPPHQPAQEGRRALTLSEAPSSFLVPEAVRIDQPLTPVYISHPGSADPGHPASQDPRLHVTSATRRQPPGSLSPVPFFSTALLTCGRGLSLI